MTDCFNCEDPIFNTPIKFEGEHFCAQCLDQIRKCVCTVCGETTFKRDIVAMQGHAIRRADGMQLINGWGDTFDGDESACVVHLHCLQIWADAGLASIDHRKDGD